MTEWVGTLRGSPGHRAILDSYNSIDPLPRGVRMDDTMPWCAAAVSAAFQKAGLIGLIPAECSCGQMVRGAMDRGIWVEEDGYHPKIGDLVFYDWQDGGQGDNTGAPDHVGLVVQVSGEGFTVAEGNMGNPSHLGLARRKFDSKTIRGFIVPDYAGAVQPWYRETMERARDMGYMDGTRPEEPALRGELAAVAVRVTVHVLEMVREMLKVEGGN